MDKTENFIVRAKRVHGEKYDYSKVEYVNSKNKVVIICKEHGEFPQNVNKHLSGQRCPKCAGTNKKATEEFIEKSKKIHGNKYDYSKVKYLTAIKNVIIICKLHGEFLQTPNSNLSGKGCLLCGRKSQSLIKSSNTDEFIKKATEVHGEKYDYSKVEYTKAVEKVIIICKEHEQYLQTPNHHLGGKGCKLCGNTSVSLIQRSNTEEFIKKAKAVHNENYDYSKVNYIKNCENVIIICKKHGEFLQMPCKHQQGGGCKLCGMDSIKNKNRITKEEFIEKAIKNHGDTYDYSKVDYVNCKSKIIIICKKHGEFSQTPDHHISQSRCPKCSCNNYSKPAIKYLNFISTLKNITIQHAENDGEFVIPNTRYKADGYCPETNTVYEFHGDYWHGNPKLFPTEEFNKTTKCCFGELYQKTLKREQQICDLGYNLVVMWEHDWKNLNNAVRTLQKVFRSKQ